jgi:glycosyltransferase involved in cell wall biosynthesis
MSDIKVSVILTCYNLEKFVRPAIDSLIRQECDFTYELIVIDDASTDKTREIIDSFNTPHLVKIFLDENGGARHAVETAFLQSRGKYICRFDGDDTWPPDFLQRASAVLDQHQDVDMVYGDTSFIDDEGRIQSEKNNISRRDKDIPVLENEFVDILKEYYINAPTIMFRREAFERALPMPAHLNNFIDWYISLKVLEKGKAYYIDDPVAFYRVHPQNMHKQMIANKTGEKVTLFILDEFVRDNPAISTSLKRRILYKNYFVLAEKYFGVQNWKAARKKYFMALQNSFTAWRSLNLWKHLVGTMIPPVYQWLQRK